MVIRAIKRLFGGHEGPSSVSPEQAELRLKALKGQLTKVKGEAKRLHTQLEQQKLSPETKASHKARMKELDAEKKEIVREMKAMQRRVPKK